MALDKSLETAAKLAAFGTGLCLVSGYVIRMLYYGRLGIRPVNFLQFEHIETGFAFLVLSALPAAFALIALKQAGGKRRQGLLLLVSGLLTCLASIVFISTLLLVVFWIPDHVWQQSTMHIYVNTRFTYFFLTAFFAACLCFLFFQSCHRRFNPPIVLQPPQIGRQGTAGLKRRDHIKLWLATGLSLGCVALLALLADRVLRVGTIVFPIGVHAVTLFAAVLVMHVSFERAKNEPDSSDRRSLMILCSIFGTILFVLLVFSYSTFIYPMIPRNRGGAYPLTSVVFTLRSTPAAELAANATVSDNRTKKLFILDDSEDFFFVTKKHDRYPPREINDVYFVRKDEVVMMRLSMDTPFATIVEDDCRRDAGQGNDAQNGTTRVSETAGS